MAAPARSLSLAVAEAAPRCQDELIVGAEGANYALMSQVQGKAFAQTVPLNAACTATTSTAICPRGRATIAGRETTTPLPPTAPIFRSRR